MSIAAVARGQLRAYIPGAPVFVNARFPSVVAGGTQVALRCRGAAPRGRRPGERGLRRGGRGAEARRRGASRSRSSPARPPRPSPSLAPTAPTATSTGTARSTRAAALVQNAGGSGTFHYLAVSPGGPGGPGPTVFLGDRVWVERVAIAHGRVSVSYLDRGFSDPMASPPTIPVSRQFALEQGALVELGSGACEVPGLADAGSFVIVTAPASGSEVLGRFTVSGCSRTFESNVNWRLLDRGGGRARRGARGGRRRGRPGPLPLHRRVRRRRAADRAPGGLRGGRLGGRGAPAAAGGDHADPALASPPPGSPGSGRGSGAGHRRRALRPRRDAAR